MRCYQCGGTTTERKVRFHLETDAAMVFVENVPARVCTQCGEEVFSMDVVEKLQRMREDIERGLCKTKPVNNVGSTAYV